MGYKKITVYNQDEHGNELGQESRICHNLRFATWNCNAYTKERHHYCHSLNYDVLGLTELHGRQHKSPPTARWIIPDKAKLNEQGKCEDPTAGVAIMLSPRMKGKIYRSGCVGSRIAWVRIKGPICPIFYVVVYIPHKYRENPDAQHTISRY